MDAILKTPSHKEPGSLVSSWSQHGYQSDHYIYITSFVQFAQDETILAAFYNAPGCINDRTVTD